MAPDARRADSRFDASDFGVGLREISSPTPEPTIGIGLALGKGTNHGGSKVDSRWSLEQVGVLDLSDARPPRPPRPALIPRCSALPQLSNRY